FACSSFRSLSSMSAPASAAGAAGLRASYPTEGYADTALLAGAIILAGRLPTNITHRPTASTTTNPRCTLLHPRHFSANTNIGFFMGYLLGIPIRTPNLFFLAERTVVAVTGGCRECGFSF